MDGRSGSGGNAVEAADEIVVSKAYREESCVKKYVLKDVSAILTLYSEIFK